MSPTKSYYKRAADLDSTLITEVLTQVMQRRPRVL